jgi:hypothetical protein
VALLTFWSLVVWGSLLLLLTGWGSLSEGLRPALGRLLPAPGAAFWAWLNAVSAALALAAWVAAALLLLWSRCGGLRAPEPPTGP